MNGAFEVRYDLDEQIAAFWFFLRKRWLWKRAVHYVAVFGTIIFLIGASQVLRDHGVDARRLIVALAIGLLAGCAGLLTLALYYRWFVPRFVRRNFQQLRLDGCSTAYRFDSDRLIIDDQFAGANLNWADLVGWAENDRFVVLYRTDYMYYYLPKHALEADMISAVKANLAAAAVPGPDPGPVLIARPIAGERLR